MPRYKNERLDERSNPKLRADFRARRDDRGPPIYIPRPKRILATKLKINTHRHKRHFKFRTAACSGPRSNQIRSAERRAMKTVGSEEHHETWAAHSRSRSADFSRARAAGYPITRYGLLRRWHRQCRTDKRHRRQQSYCVARPIPRRSDERDIFACAEHKEQVGRI